jgi:hypothetical protein
MLKLRMEEDVSRHGELLRIANILINSSGQPTKDGFGGRLTSSYFKEMLNRWAGTEASSELL